MNKYKITINEFPDKPRVSRYSIKYNSCTWGWYSLNRILEEIKKIIKRENENNTRIHG